eukprot:scaffold1373_cov288-Alexandrium_tamarense.AAC.5
MSVPSTSRVTRTAGDVTTQIILHVSVRSSSIVLTMGNLTFVGIGVSASMVSFAYVGCGAEA